MPVISFRFHIVSLVAVFLALGLGILTGTTVINRGLVSQLEDQTAQLSRDFEQQRADLTELQQRVDRATDFGDAVVPYLVEGRLAQREVVVLTNSNADTDAIGGVQTALDEARAEVVALLSIDGGLAALTEEQRSELAAEIGIDPEDDGTAFASAVGSALAGRLAFGPEPGAPDPLAVLLEQGFVGNQGPPLDDAALSQLAPDAFVVVGGAGQPTPAPPALISLVEALAEAGAVVDAVEGLNSVQPFVEELRGGPAADAISTQDNVDEVFGVVGLVIALDDMLDGGEPGHFGVKDGATGVIPPAA